MKTFIKKIYILAAIMATLIACNKESNEIKEEIADAAGKPEGSLSVVLPGSAAWNDVTVNVNASHPKGKIEKVELFADGQLVGADHEAPYQFTWDTRFFEDGNIMLMARITDELDNFTDLNKQVTVKNTLIDFDLHNQYFAMDPNFKYYTFITGENRETLFFEMADKLPYQKKIMRPDGYNSETVQVSFVNANGQKGKIVSYHSVTPGKFAPPVESLKGAKLGDGNVKFTNVPAHEYYRFGEIGGDLLEENKPYKAGIFQNSNTGYIYLRNGAQGSYKIINDLSLAEQEVSLSDMTSTMKYFKIDLPEILEGAVYKLDAHLGPEMNAPEVNLFYTYNFGNMENFKINFHIPVDAKEFHHLSSSFNIVQNGKSYLTTMFNGLLKAPEHLHVDFSAKSQTLENVELSTAGDSFDVLITTWDIDANGYMFTWESHSANTEMSFPPIPPQLTNVFPNSRLPPLFLKMHTSQCVQPSTITLIPMRTISTE